MNPVDRQAIQGSVANHPGLWQEAMQDYYNHSRECLNSLLLRSEGLQINYSEELGDFVQGLNITDVGNLRRQALILYRRERQIQRIALRVTQPNTPTSFRDQIHLIQGCEEAKRIYRFLMYKLNYRDQPEDNNVFSTPRLSKLFAKITKDNPKIKDIEEKEADAKPKAFGQLNARKRDLEQQLKNKLPRDRTIDRFETNVEELRTDAETLEQPLQGKILNFLDLENPYTVTLQKLVDCNIIESDVASLGYKKINYLFSPARAILTEAKKNLPDIEKLREDIRTVDDEIQAYPYPKRRIP